MKYKLGVILIGIWIFSACSSSEELAQPQQSETKIESPSNPSKSVDGENEPASLEVEPAPPIQEPSSEQQPSQTDQIEPASPDEESSPSYDLDDIISIPTLLFGRELWVEGEVTDVFPLFFVYRIYDESFTHALWVYTTDSLPNRTDRIRIRGVLEERHILGLNIGYVLHEHYRELIE
jgi:hypothetical protein